VLDPSYRTLFASPGVPQWLDGDLRAASRSFALTRQLDPDDAASGIGLGSIAAEEGRWFEAEAYARDVLARDPDSIDAHRLLARVLAHQNRRVEAIEHYERSLLLALSGERPLDGLLTSAPGPDRLLDDAHARVHAELAGLYGRVGELRRAVTAYRMAMAGGCSNLALTLRLAACLWRQGHPAAAGRQLLAGARQLPSAVRLRLRRARRRRMRP
jgi:predicted Zn-dependent protease